MVSVVHRNEVENDYLSFLKSSDIEVNNVSWLRPEVKGIKFLQNNIQLLYI